MELWSEFLNHRGRAIHKWTSYFPAYERHLGRFRGQAVTLIEIGCGAGGSLQLWKRFLGPYARIVGIDINPACKIFEEDQIAVRIGDQTDTAFLENVLNEFGPVQVVIDDGSHLMRHITQTFDFSYMHNAMDTCGVYAVEDLHTAYWEEYGGGLLREGSFIETAKSQIDQMHAAHSRGAVPPSAFMAATLSIHIYDSLIIYERGRRRPNLSLLQGGGAADAASVSG